MARVAAIHGYPVKSMGGVQMNVCALDPCGLAGDRRWMVVDEAGGFRTQRELGLLATIEARPVDAENLLVLSHDDGDAIRVKIPASDAPEIPVTVWRSTVPARVASDEVNAWISRICGCSCRLVHLFDPGARPTNPDSSEATDRVSFADGYPVSVLNLASLADLNSRLARPMEVARFRPNVVIADLPAYDEDRWRAVRIGGATFRVPKPIDRCVMTTFDPKTGRAIPGRERDEPLRTLARYRRISGGVLFGVHLIPTTLAPLRVGDSVDVQIDGPPPAFL